MKLVFSLVKLFLTIVFCWIGLQGEYYIYENACLSNVTHTRYNLNGVCQAESDERGDGRVLRAAAETHPVQGGEHQDISTFIGESELRIDRHVN